MSRASRVPLDPSWEQPPNSVPTVLETSSDGQFVVAQWGQIEGPGGAAIWDVSSKKTVWRVRGTRVATWVGEQVVAVRTTDAGEELAWYDWPDGAERGAIRVRFPLGRLTHPPRIFGDRQSSLAAVVWLDQTEGGIELFRRGPGGWMHLADAGWWQDRCNYVGDVKFSADGHWLAFAVGTPDGWEEREKAYAGVVVVYECATARRAFLDLFAKLEPGWKMTSRASPIPEILTFSSPAELCVRLQNDEELSLSIDPEALGQPG